MMKLLLSSNIRTRKNLILINVVNTFVSLFFLIFLLRYFMPSYENQLLVKTYFFSYFSSIVFEIIFYNIDFIRGDKLIDLKLSKKSLIGFLSSWYFFIAVSLLPVLIINITIGCLIYNIDLKLFDFVTFTLITVFIAVLMGIYMFLFQIRDVESFHRINLFMDFYEIISCTNYPYTSLPIVLKQMAFVSFFSVLSFYIDFKIVFGIPLVFLILAAFYAVYLCDKEMR